MGFYCEWLQLTAGVTLRGASVGMAAWLGCWGHCNFACFLWAVALCYFLFPVPGLVLSTRASILTHWHSTFPLPPFSCSADTSFNSSSSSALPSSHPPISCPILPQIWGSDPDFPSDPCLHTFLCFLKCWSRFADFLLLFDWWREPVQECPRSSGLTEGVTKWQLVKEGRWGPSTSWRMSKMTLIKIQTR